MRLYLAGLALFMALAGCGSSTSGTSGYTTLGEAFQGAVPEESIGTFASALRTPALADVLEELDSETNPHTVFVPSNDTFEAYFREVGITKEEFLASSNLREVILTHIVRGGYNANDIVPGATFESMNGTTLTVSSSGDDLLINGAALSSRPLQQDPPPATGFFYCLLRVIVP